MIPAEYTVYLLDPNGKRYQVCTDVIEMQIARAINVPGTLTIRLPASSLNTKLSYNDWRLEVWRRVSHRQVLVTNTVWLINSIVLVFDGSRQYWDITATSALALLQRRYVLYSAGSGGSSKSGKADAIITEIIAENLGDDASDASRSISGYGFSIMAASGNSPCPTLTKEFAYRNVLTVCQEIATASAQAGVPLFFDIQYAGDANPLRFSHYRYVLGTDRSNGNNLTMSPDLGNLVNPIVTFDYSQEYNFVYAAGQGQGANRISATAEDVTRSKSGPLHRIETFIDLSNISVLETLQSEANAALQAGKPKIGFTAKLLNTDYSQYGVDWDWGDRVLASVGGYQFTCNITKLLIKIASGKETIEGTLEVI